MVRVRAVIKTDSGYVMMHRIRDGKEFFVFPGGGVEDGESLEEAVVRECLEELGVTVKVESKLLEKDDTLYYSAKILSGKLGTGTGEEFQNMKENNFYEVVVVSDFEGKIVYPHGYEGLM